MLSYKNVNFTPVIQMKHNTYSLTYHTIQKKKNYSTILLNLER